LKDDDPVAFEMFLKFAYEGTIEKPITGWVYKTENPPTLAEATAKETELRQAFDTHSMKLVRLYILGETYGMEDLMNCTMDTIQDGQVLCHKP
jgi:hypothetical protein